MQFSIGINPSMQRQARQYLLASLLALYGLMTVCGPALHAISGVDQIKAGTSADGDRADHLTLPHDDCPICQFSAQGQIAGEFFRVLSIDVVRIQPADDLPISFPASIDRPSTPRAPPIV